MSFDRTRLPEPVGYYESTGLAFKERKGKWRTTACNFHGGTDSLRINTDSGAFVCMAGCGARGGDVLIQFLIESMLLALLGGLAGLSVALLATTILRAVLPQLDATIRVGSVLLATGISAGIGVFFGLYPASRASRMNPIEALRYE